MTRKLVPMTRPPGRPPKHGARALARAIENGKLDRRSRPAKQRQLAANLLAEDAGGWPYLNNREVALIWSTASVWVLLNVRLDALLAGAKEDEGSLKWLVALLNSFRRNLEVLGLRPERLEDRMPSLQDYIASKAGNGNGTPGSAAGTQGDDRTAGEARVQATGHEAGTACGAGCADCHCADATMGDGEDAA